MIPASIREQIIEAMTARITVELGTCLRVPRIQRGYEGDVLLGLIDEDDVPEKIEYGAIRKVMRITVQYVQRFDPDTENESIVANKMLADLEWCVTGSDRTFGGLCLDTRYAAGVPSYDATTPTEFAACVAAFEVWYQTDLGDPYTDSNPH